MEPAAKCGIGKYRLKYKLTAGCKKGVYVNWSGKSVQIKAKKKASHPQCTSKGEMQQKMRRR